MVMTLLLIVALLCFVAAAFRLLAGRVELVAFGLALVTLAMLLGRL